jgi:Asp-tRNA(Asn)/Glu-tRNA(Gln) amidotransferase A subunit family amidase
MTKPLNELSAAEAARHIEAGDCTAEALAAACLERIAARDEEVRVWSFVDRSRALAQARALDRMPRRGRLHTAFDADTALLGWAHWVEGVLG